MADMKTDLLGSLAEYVGVLSHGWVRGGKISCAPFRVFWNRIEEKYRRDRKSVV